MTRNALWPYFAHDALEQIVSANVAQDSPASLFGMEAHRHFCDRALEHSFAYIESEHAAIAELARKPGCEGAQRAAFGRLLHTAQDFYAHSNYVDLWLNLRGAPAAARSAAGPGDESPRPQAAAVPAPTDAEAIHALDAEVLNHPALQIGDWVPWRDIIFYVPVLGDLARRVWVPEGSHEAMHLDSPERGPRFNYAVESARKRTLLEYERAAQAIQLAAGPQALARFHLA